MYNADNTTCIKCFTVSCILVLKNTDHIFILNNARPKNITVIKHTLWIYNQRRNTFRLVGVPSLIRKVSMLNSYRYREVYANDVDM